LPLLSQKEVLNLKLSCIPLSDLKILSQNLDVNNIGTAVEIIKRILEENPNEKVIDEFIRSKYLKKIQERRTIISDENLKKELLKVKTFSWGVIQGQLDQKIQPNT